MGSRPASSCMVLMHWCRRFLPGFLLLLAACHLEDRTPLGSRRDEAQIREVIVEYYRGLAAHDWSTIRNFFAPGGMVSYPGMVEDSATQSIIQPADSVFLRWARVLGDRPGLAGDAQIMRADLRQVDGIAAVWVTVRINLPYPHQEDMTEETQEHVDHVVLHRTADGWRIVLLSSAQPPR
jgi:hypothetical protein